MPETTTAIAPAGKPADSIVVFTVGDSPMVAKRELWRQCGSQTRFSKFVLMLLEENAAFSENYAKHRRKWFVPTSIAAQFLRHIHGPQCQFNFLPEPQPQ